MLQVPPLLPLSLVRPANPAATAACASRLQQATATGPAGHGAATARGAPSAAAAASAATPLFVLLDAGGALPEELAAVAAGLGDGGSSGGGSGPVPLQPLQPIYCLQLPSHVHLVELRSLPALAAVMCSAIKAEQPHGPYLVGGVGFSGPVAYEVAVHVSMWCGGGVRFRDSCSGGVASGCVGCVGVWGRRCAGAGAASLTFGGRQGASGLPCR